MSGSPALARQSERETPAIMSEPVPTPKSVFTIASARSSFSIGILAARWF